MSAFKTSEDEIKRLIRRVGVGFDPAGGTRTTNSSWPARSVKRPNRWSSRRTRWTPRGAGELRGDYQRSRLRSPDDRPLQRPRREGAEVGEQAGVVDYRPGDADFDILGDVSGDQEEGLEQIRDFLEEFGATGSRRPSRRRCSTYSA